MSMMRLLSIITSLLVVTTTTTAFQTHTPSFAVVVTAVRRHRECESHCRRHHACLYASTVDSSASTTNTNPTEEEEEALHRQQEKELLLESIRTSGDEAKEWSNMFGLSESEAAFYALFKGIRSSNLPLGLRGHPFVLSQTDVINALEYNNKNDDDFATNTNTNNNDEFCCTFKGWFTIRDLEKAVNDDFLDADRGSTDSRKGWKVASVSEPSGKSFEDAKLTFPQVRDALQKGTVIFNSAGAHICKLAGANLAAVDATSLPCAVNIYVTAPHQRTSAPPHTDKQDVVVTQMTGRKHWRVYSPPDPSQKPMADMFARGKHSDNLPLYALESTFGCQLLLETTLEAGDVLFIPAAFPHTTSTVDAAAATGATDDSVDADEDEETSIHLTFGLDTHIWDLDYLSVRRFALRRAGVLDTALQQTKDDDNRYVGLINDVPHDVLVDLLDVLPLGLLDDTEEGKKLLNDVATRVQEISNRVDAETASAVDSQVWKDTAARVRQEGMEVLDIHRDMFLAAIEEGRLREAEDAMTAHLGTSVDSKKKLSPERIARLSCFRVKDYFDKINDSMQAMLDWSNAGTTSKNKNSDSKSSASPSASTVLPDDWAFTLPVKVGDQVEADLGGAFFPATVARVDNNGNKYDVQFFDGDSESGLQRRQIKLTSPPPAAQDEEEEVDTSNMTPKQLKRWKKQQEKKNKKK